MMATPEADFAARVRDGLRPHGVDTERIENRVNLGVSDMLVGAGDRFAAVELKVVQRGLKVALRPHQTAFLARHAAAGRPCFVLVLHKGSLLRASRVLLFTGSQAVELAANGLKTEPVRAWNSRGMDWSELAALLSGKAPIAGLAQPEQ